MTYELVVITLLNNSTFLDDQNTVGPLDRRETVGNYKGRAIFEKLVKRILYQPFALGIETRGGLIKNQDGRVLDKGPSDG